MASTTPVLDLRRVRYFLALSDSLRFGNTARRLGISQPALSKAIARLEEELGGKLIRREGRLTHLTQLGAAMRSEFSNLERVAVRSRERAQQIVRGTRSQLRIAITPTLGPRRIAAFLETSFRSHPNAEISLRSALPYESRELLLDGCVDCAFVIGARDDEPRLKCYWLYSELLAVLHPVNHPFAYLDAITTDLIAMEPIVGRPTHRYGASEKASGFPHTQLTDTDAPISQVVQSDREEWIRALVRSGHGVALVSADSYEGDGLALTPLEGPGKVRDIFFEVATGRMDNHAISCFVDRARTHTWTAKRQTL